MTHNGATVEAVLMAVCGQHNECGGCSGQGCEQCNWTGRLNCACVRGDSEGRGRGSDWSHGVATVGTVCHDCGEVVPTGTSVMLLAMPGDRHPLVFAGECVITGIGAPHGVAHLPA